MKLRAEVRRFWATNSTICWATNAITGRCEWFVGFVSLKNVATFTAWIKDGGVNALCNGVFAESLDAVHRLTTMSMQWQTQFHKNFTRGLSQMKLSSAHLSVCTTLLNITSELLRLQIYRTHTNMHMALEADGVYLSTCHKLRRHWLRIV